MWIDAPQGTHVRRARVRFAKALRPGAGWVGWPVVLSLATLIACGGGSESGEGNPASSGSPGSTDMSSAPSAASPQPETVGDLFPVGEGRDLVLNNCASCHAAACAVIGQRTAARWNGLKEGHADRLPTLAEGELDVIFSYLQGHFNDTQPEPSVPPAFLAAGCTPF